MKLSVIDGDVTWDHMYFGTKCQHIANPALTLNAYIFSYTRNEYRLTQLASTDTSRMARRCDTTKERRFSDMVLCSHTNT